MSAGFTPGDFTFLAFGDIQVGIDRFDDIIEFVNREENIDFILMLGDLSETAAPSEFVAVNEAFSRIRWPIYSTPGNHDAFAKRYYQDDFGRATYSITHRGARFTSVDSASGGLEPVVWDRVEKSFEQGRDQLHVAFSHIPAIESLGIRAGQWNSPREARRFVGLALEHRMDLLLFGHIHSYDAYLLGGIPTHISGGCGGIEERLDGIDRHYLRMRASPSRGTLGPLLFAASLGSLRFAGRDFEAVTASRIGPEDAFLIELSATDSIRSFFQAGDADQQSVSSFAVNGSHVAISGAFVGTLDFGKGPLAASSSGSSVFVAGFRR